MHTVIQIPAWNEEQTLALVLADLPRQIPGATRVSWLVVDDGSSDETARIARAHGADEVVRLPVHRGLADAFRAGLQASLAMGADVVVNTDADHQYRGRDVARVAAPVLGGAADLVVGERDFRALRHRWVRGAGGAVVRRVSATEVRDACSGLRAFGRAAAARLEVTSSFTYTIETLIRAGRAGMRVEGVPVATNPALRPSRLFGSSWEYVGRTGPSILRLWLET